jgi:hypothetical protein
MGHPLSTCDWKKKNKNKSSPDFDLEFGHEFFFVFLNHQTKSGSRA